MESEFSGYTDEEWWSDPRLKRVDVVVCTATCALEESAYRLPHQRLLDAGHLCHHDWTGQSIIRMLLTTNLPLQLQLGHRGYYFCRPSYVVIRIH